MLRHSLALLVLLTTACAQGSVGLEFKKLSPEDKLKLAKSCPAPENLARDKIGRWVSKDKQWKSNSNASFLTKITHFTAARFQGAANIGDIICIYRGDGNDFPIVLSNNALIMRPDTPGWTYGRKTQSFMICKKSLVSCSFIYTKDALVTEKKPKNIYKSLKQIKPIKATPKDTKPAEPIKRMPKVDNINQE